MGKISGLENIKMFCVLQETAKGIGQKKRDGIWNFQRDTEKSSEKETEETDKS
jgi:hypothetical protein